MKDTYPQIISESGSLAYDVKMGLRNCGLDKVQLRYTWLGVIERRLNHQRPDLLFATKFFDFLGSLVHVGFLDIGKLTEAARKYDVPLPSIPGWETSIPDYPLKPLPTGYYSFLQAALESVKEWLDSCSGLEENSKT